jgi:hypothetical protein
MEYPRVQRGNEDLVAELERFITDSDRLDAAETEKRLLPVLVGLMEAQGYRLVNQVRPDATFTDFVTEADPHNPRQKRVGVGYKHYAPPRRVGVNSVEQMLGIFQRTSLEKILLIARPGFTREAIETARRNTPVDLELFDYDRLRSMAHGLARKDEYASSRIATLIRALSAEAARIVARDPRELENLEWRRLGTNDGNSS